MKSNTAKVILGLIISTSSIFIPLMLSSLSNEQFIGNSNPYSIIVLLIYVSIFLSIITFIISILLIKKSFKHIGIGMIIPSIIFLLFVLF